MKPARILVFVIGWAIGVYLGGKIISPRPPKHHTITVYRANAKAETYRIIGEPRMRGSWWDGKAVWGFDCEDGWHRGVLLGAHDRIALEDSE